MDEENKTVEGAEAEPTPPPFDVGLANRVLEDSLTLTAQGNFEDDRLHIMRSGDQINIELKMPNGAQRVFAGVETELRHAESIQLFRSGAWVPYLVGKATEARAAVSAAKPSDFQDIDDADLFKAE